jgi:pimeloyl-ACP methyl ester carboxylesterase
VTNPSRKLAAQMRAKRRTAAGIALLALASACVAAAAASSHGTVWLCRPGMPADPCTASLTTTVVSASGKHTVSSPAPTASKQFDCFYAYPTVSTEPAANANLEVQRSEIDTAEAQASRFSQVCQVYAPIYSQVTLAGLVSGAGASPDETVTAYDSIASGFEDFLQNESDGRPIILIGHSQGAAMLILLMHHLVDDAPSLRDRLVLAIVLGGNVAVPRGRLVGGSFQHIPACSRTGETGCVIAYSSFPSTPPAGAFFGRPGQGVSLQSNQTAKSGLEVVCVNPAAIGGGSGTLDPYFPSLGAAATPWVSYPGLYTARCEQSSGASWLEVTKATGPSDRRPLVSETDGPLWGYHPVDVNVALGNLVSDVAAAESSWRAAHGG